MTTTTLPEALADARRGVHLDSWYDAAIRLQKAAATLADEVERLKREREAERDARNALVADNMRLQAIVDRLPQDASGRRIIAHPTEVATPFILRGNAEWVEVMLPANVSTPEVARELRAAADDYERLADENAALRNALRRCRTFLRDSGQMTLLRFAALCATPAVQISMWTGDEVTRKPDFID